MKLESIVKLIGSLLIALSVVVMAGVMFLYIPKVNRFLDLKARHDCAQDNNLEYNDEKTQTTIHQPVADLYQKCLSEKGLQ